MQQNLNWHGDFFTNGETYTAKTPPDDFKVTTPENSLLKVQKRVQNTFERLDPQVTT